MQKIMKSFSFLLVSVSAIALIGCWSPGGGPVMDMPDNGAVQPKFPSSFYSGISAEEGRVFEMDSEASEARLFLWRGGLLAEKGHNHVMRVKKMKSAFFLPNNMLDEEARLDIVFQAKDIEVDPMPLRKEIGGSFAGTGMTPEGVQGTRENMLGEKVLDAVRFPTIGFRTKRIIGELPRLVLDTVITLHGLERQTLIPVTAQVQEDRLTVEGAFVIEQTNFGIEPFSALGGALYIKDPIMIEFDLAFRAR